MNGSIRRSPHRRRVSTGIFAALGLVALALLGASPATAQDTPQAAPEVRGAQQVKAGLDALARSPGTIGLSWGVDPATRRVVISAPRGDDDAATTAFLDRARAMSSHVRVQRVPAAPELQLSPGDAIFTEGWRCSSAVAATDGSASYVVTAGHCTNLGDAWTASGGQVIGTVAASSFPGNDYGTIRVTNSSLALDNRGITQVGRPAVGSAVQKVGSTTGVTSGTIVGYNRTVNYSEGTVRDMIETTACTQGGDSGGLLYQNSTGIGITSGGTVGQCRPGFQSFFQPLDEALSSQRLTLR